MLRPNLEGKEQKERFNAVRASVYKISHEDVVGLWDFPANLKAQHQ